MQVERIDSHDWLGLLSAPRQRVELCTVRYHRRRGPWSGHHRTPHQHLLVWCEQGGVEVRERARFELGPGDLLWVPPGYERHIRGGRGNHAKHINCRFVVGRDQPVPTPHTRPLLRTDCWNLRETLLQLLDCLTVATPFRAIRIRALLTAVTATLLAEPGDERGGERGLSAGQRQRVYAYVAEHIAETIDGADIAALLGLSHDYCTRLFSASFGLAPRTWVVHERMRQAAALLVENDDSVTAVAASLGVDNPSLFIRQFRNVHGCTPLQYRRRHQVDRS